MSSDDGYILRQNAEGKYVLQNYFASADSYPPVEAALGHQIHDTLEEAILAYQAFDAEFSSEYGLTINVSPKKESNKVQTEKYIRKPFAVDAVQVTEENMARVAEWCQGEIQQVDSNKGEASGNRYIKVRVHNPMTPRQTQAHVGDWILYSGKGYKVYTEKAFVGNFDRPENTPDEPSLVVNNVFEQNGSSGL